MPNFVPGGMESDSDEDDYTYSSRFKPVVPNGIPPSAPPQTVVTGASESNVIIATSDTTKNNNNEDEKEKEKVPPVSENGFVPAKVAEPFDWGAALKNDMPPNSAHVAEAADEIVLGPEPGSFTTPATRRLIDDLEIFLIGLNLQELTPLFQQQLVSLSDLLQFTEEDLIRCGVEKIGQRKLILNATYAAHRAKFRSSSIPEMKSSAATGDLISCADAIHISATIAKHLNYIDATMAYLEQRILTRPDMLQYGTNFGGVSLPALHEHLLKVHAASDVISRRLRNFSARIEILSEDVEYDVPDLIGPNAINNRKPNVNLFKSIQRVGGGGGKRKTRKWLAMGIALGGILASLASYVLVKDHIVYGGVVLVDLVSNRYSLKNE